MRCLRRTHRRPRSAALTALIILALTVPAAHGQQIIVNTGVGEESLSLNGIRAIFFMRLVQWPSDGRPIKVFVLPDRDPLHIRFSKSVLDVFPRQLRRSWDRLVFSGTGQAPIEVSDEQQMVDAVSTTPGAVGYLMEVKKDANVRPLAVE